MLVEIIKTLLMSLLIITLTLVGLEVVLLLVGIIGAQLRKTSSNDTVDHRCTDDPFSMDLDDLEPIELKRPKPDITVEKTKRS